jgi:hypothetical protein
LPLGCYFFLDKKVTKKSSQQKGFFSERAFAHKREELTGCPAIAPKGAQSLRFCNI